MITGERINPISHLGISTVNNPPSHVWEIPPDQSRRFGVNEQLPHAVKPTDFQDAGQIIQNRVNLPEFQNPQPSIPTPEAKNYHMEISPDKSGWIFTLDNGLRLGSPNTVCDYLLSKYPQYNPDEFNQPCLKYLGELKQIDGREFAPNFTERVANKITIPANDLMIDTNHPLEQRVVINIGEYPVNYGYFLEALSASAIPATEELTYKDYQKGAGEILLPVLTISGLGVLVSWVLTRFYREGNRAIQKGIEIRDSVEERIIAVQDFADSAKNRLKGR